MLTCCVFVQGCFLESVDKATLCCPLCRRRVSTWARLNGRNNTLVNQQLWTQIQTAFPLQCQRRLSGQDAVAEDDPGGTTHADAWTSHNTLGEPLGLSVSGSELNSLCFP